MKSGFLRLFFLTLSIFPNFSYAVTLDLSDFRAVGEKQLQDAFGSKPEVEGIFFRDGAAAYDSSSPQDLAAIFLVAKIPSIELGQYRFAYVANMDATSSILLVTVSEDGGGKFNTIFSKPLKGIGTFPTTAAPAEMKTLVDELKNKYPDVNFNLMSFIGSLSFEAKSLSQSIEIMTTLVKNGIVTSFSKLVYASPLAIDPSIQLSNGLNHEIVDIESLRSVTVALKEKGANFKTTSALPEELRTNQPHNDCKHLLK